MKRHREYKNSWMARRDGRKASVVTVPRIREELEEEERKNRWAK